MIDRQACRCASCRARDARAFERIAKANPPTPRERSQARVFEWRETASLRARIAAYTYGERKAA